MAAKKKTPTEDLNHRSALSVMGWRYSKPNKHCVASYLNKSGNIESFVHDWRPSTNKVQAFMLLEKLITDCPRPIRFGLLGHVGVNGKFVYGVTISMGLDILGRAAGTHPDSVMVRAIVEAKEELLTYRCP